MRGWLQAVRCTVTGAEVLVVDAPAMLVRTEAPSAQQAITALYVQHYRGLMRQALALVDHETAAEEIVQDAFEQLLRRWGTLRDPGAAATYLRRSVVNGSRDRLRRRQTRRLASLPAAGLVHSAEQTVLLSARDRQLIDAVAQLPRRQREVIALRYFLDWTEAEVADVLGITKGAVKSTGHKGIAALRARLEEVDQ